MENKLCLNKGFLASFIFTLLALTLLPLSILFSKEIDILAVVNEQKISVQDFMDFYKTRPRIARWESSESPQDNPKKILEDLIDKTLMAQEAYTLFPRALKQHEREIADFENKSLINYFSEKQINQGIQISEQEIFTRMPENKKIEIHLRRLVVVSLDEAIKHKAELDKGADFEKFIRKFSLAEDAAKGGDIGYMTFDKGIFPKKVVEKLFQMKIGEISEPEKIREGFALFQLLAKRKVSPSTLERNKDYIRQKISLERKKERWGQLFEQLKKDASVIVNEALFKELEASVSMGKTAALLSRVMGLEIARIKGNSILLGELIPKNQNLSFGATKPWEKDISILRRALEQKIKVFLVSEYARQLNYHQAEELKKNTSRFKDDLMVKKLITEKVYKGLKVTFKECQNYYQKHLADYWGPEQIRIDQIILQDEIKISDLFEQLKKGANFKEVSEIHSSPKDSWLKGFFAKGGSGLGTEFENQVFTLLPGQISSPIRTFKGYHLVKLLEKKEASYIDLDEVKANIKEKILSSKKEKALDNYIGALKQKSHLTINNPLLQETIKNEL